MMHLLSSESDSKQPGSFEGSFPLSFAQQRLWFLERLALEGAGYTIPNAYCIRGGLNIDALKSSLSKLIRRHQMLRASFRDVKGQPRQMIADTISLHLANFDLRYLPSNARETEAYKIAESDANQRFDLADAPLWRTTLIQLDSQHYWFLFTVHHIIFDGWSADLFFDELMALYTAECEGKSIDLPQLPYQYTDFVCWQQQRLQGQALEALLEYWRRRLSSGLQPLELPTDFIRPSQSTYRGATASLVISNSLTDELRFLSQQQQTTLFTTLLAVFKVLLYRYTNRTDIVVGTPLANRSRPEFAKIVGFLVNTIVLRTALDGQQSFLQLLDQVKATVIEAYEHGDLPFDVLVDALRPERDLSYNPMFQVMFQLHNRATGSSQTTTINSQPIALNTAVANFDLTLDIEETESGLIAEFEYSTDLFETETIHRMLGHFQTLLEAVVTDPHQSIARLPLLTGSERRQLLDVWNRAQTHDIAPQDLVNKADLAITLRPSNKGVIGEVIPPKDLANVGAIAAVLEQLLPQLQKIAAEPDYQPPQVLPSQNSPLARIEIAWDQEEMAASAAPKCLHRYFEEQVRRTPNAIALTHQNQHLTYAELNTQANQLAHFLIAEGVKPDTLVGLCCERSLELIVALFAVLKAGAAYLSLDPDYPQERLDYMVDDAQISIILTHSSLQYRLPSGPKIVCLDPGTKDYIQQPKTNPNVAVATHHLAYVIYTSGSTGRPKGVMIEHRAAAYFIQSAIARYKITDSDQILQFASVNFDVAVEEIFPSLAAGARLYLRNEDMLSAASRFFQTCEEWGITVLNLPTAYWQQLTAAISNGHLHLPQTVRLVIIGGERVLPAFVKTWQQSVGNYPVLMNAYGPTETTVTATVCHIKDDLAIQREVPIGRPLSNTEVYVLDANRQLMPIGIPGELYIGGDSVARGYLHRPDLTQLRFIPNPFSSVAGAKLYKTGDRVRYRSDGTLEFLGRTDNQVKIRGFRIELGEVEAALLQYPGVHQTAVIVREDSASNARLVAYVVEHPEQSVPFESLQDFLRKQLPHYMVPAAIVLLEALPLTPNGKIDIRALPAPTGKVADETQTFVAPRTPLEEVLVNIWTETLELPKISIQDNFFRLGGHSLQAVQIIARIAQELEIELSLSAIFQFPTVEEMAKELLQAGAKAPWSPLVPIQSQGTKRPFFAIHGGHGEVSFYQQLADCLGTDQPFYALRALGNDYPDMAHQRIEDMAACYIEAIRKIQPQGPYQVGGASLGGIVAFEIAQQLTAQGQVVEALVIFDTGGFDNYTSPLPRLQQIINGFRYVPKYGLGETWRRLKLKFLKLVTLDSAVEFYRATGQLPNSSSPELAIWQGVWEANLDALEKYRPRLYPGKLLLLRATDDPDYMWNQIKSDYGWGAYVEQGVVSYGLPGYHMSIFKQPNVRQLAQIVKQHLQMSE